MHAKIGDRVAAGQPLLDLHTDEPARFEQALAALDGAYHIGGSVRPRPLILDRIADADAGAGSDAGTSGG
jgi:thymidine phosphorylase